MDKIEWKEKVWPAINGHGVAGVALLLLVWRLWFRRFDENLALGWYFALVSAVYAGFIIFNGYRFDDPRGTARRQYWIGQLGACGGHLFLVLAVTLALGQINADGDIASSSLIFSFVVALCFGAPLPFMLVRRWPRDQKREGTLVATPAEPPPPPGGNGKDKRSGTNVPGPDLPSVPEPVTGPERIHPPE